MAVNKWPIEQEADTFFESAIKSKINDASTWNVWIKAFWPLVEKYHSARATGQCNT
jgi:hypothetical protein